MRSGRVSRTRRHNTDKAQWFLTDPIFSDQIGPGVRH